MLRLAAGCPAQPCAPPPPYSSPAHAHPNPRDPLFAVLCARGAQAVVVGGAPNSGQWGPRVVTTVGGKGGASVQLVAECCVRCCPFGALRRGLEGGGLIGTEPTFATKPIEGSSKLNPHVPVPGSVLCGWGLRWYTPWQLVRVLLVWLWLWHVPVGVLAVSEVMRSPLWGANSAGETRSDQLPV